MKISFMKVIQGLIGSSFQIGAIWALLMTGDLVYAVALSTIAWLILTAKEN